ncbi:restriction endonuclease subunit S [Aeromonas veronii]
MTLTAMPQYDAYKNSGIEWLGDIPKHWLLKKAKYLLSEVNIRSESGGERLLSLSKYHGMVPKDSLEERSGGAASLIGYKKVSVNQLVVNKMQAVNGLLAVSSLEGITSPDYSVYEAKGVYTTNIKYIEYLLTQPEYLAEFKRRVTGVMDGFIRLYTDDLFAIKIIHPPLEEQARLVSFLDDKTAKIDEAIAIKEQQIALLNERKQILIQQAVTQGLDPSVPMKDSNVAWIGKIPEHWQIKRLKFVLDERSERSLTGEEPLFMVSQQYGLVVRADYHEKAVVAASNIDSKIVYKNDLVFNKLKAHLGVFFKSNIDFKGIVSPDYAVYKIKDYISDTKILELLFRNPLYIEQFTIRATGIVEGLIRLYTSDLFDISIPIAPIDEQLKILAHIEKMSALFDKTIEIHRDQCEKLKEYKTTLINSAVTGKIKVV